MNILFITYFVVGFIVSEIPRMSVFGYFPLHTSLGHTSHYYDIIGLPYKGHRTYH